MQVNLNREQAKGLNRLVHHHLTFVDIMTGFFNRCRNISRGNRTKKLAHFQMRHEPEPQTDRPYFSWCLLAALRASWLRLSRSARSASNFSKLALFASELCQLATIVTRSRASHLPHR